MAHKLEITPAEVIVTEDVGENADGSKAQRTWTMNPDQAGKHVEGGMFSGLRKGDKSALLDRANEHRKEMAKRAA